MVYLVFKMIIQISWMKEQQNNYNCSKLSANTYKGKRLTFARIHGAISPHSRLACPTCHVPSVWGRIENPAL